MPAYGFIKLYAAIVAFTFVNSFCWAADAPELREGLPGTQSGECLRQVSFKGAGRSWMAVTRCFTDQGRSEEGSLSSVIPMETID